MKEYKLGGKIVYDSEKEIFEVEGNIVDIASLSTGLIYLCYQSFLKENPTLAEQYKNLMKRSIKIAFMTEDERLDYAKKQDEQNAKNLKMLKEAADGLKKLLELAEDMEKEEKKEEDTKFNDEIDNFHKWLYGDEEE